jgi:hypothetical protein
MSVVDARPPFGLLVVMAMLIFYALKDLSPRYILAFAAVSHSLPAMGCHPS